MDEQQMTQWVVKQLGRHRAAKDIVQELAMNGDLSWRDAERFVAKVQETHGKQIARAQSPLFVFFGVMLLLGGIGYMAYIGYITLVQGVNMIIIQMPIPYGGNMLNFGLGFLLFTGGLFGIFGALGSKPHS
jgi:hypothetical protein